MLYVAIAVIFYSIGFVFGMYTEGKHWDAQFDGKTVYYQGKVYVWSPPDAQA